MYIRKSTTKNRKTGATYTTYRLVEAIRKPEGPRQRVLLHLGQLDLTKLELKKLAKIFEAKFIGQTSLFDGNSKLMNIADQAMQNRDFRQIVLKNSDTTAPDSELTSVNINSAGLAEIRSAGPEIVGHAFWEKLGLGKALHELGFSPFEIGLSAGVILGRLIQPGSELQTRNWLNDQSALLELLDLDRIGKNAIYEIADRLLAHKDSIERYLWKQEQILFPKASHIFLYDLTNTYLEGVAAGNTLAKRGFSKEKRSDCPLVTMALLVDSRGFPVFSQIYRGNQAEPETLESVLTRLEKDFKGILPSFRPTVVMDRGIATASNIALIKNRQFPYVVVERRRTEKDYEQEFADTASFSSFETTSGPILLKKIALENGARVLVKSEGRIAKERAMDSLKEKRFLEDVEKLAGSVQKGNVVLPEKVGRRIGRILQRYPSMAPFYKIETELDELGKRISRVTVIRKPSAKKVASVRGCYVIETSRKNLDAKEIWDLYTTLHRVEKGFRCLKSDLGFRPIHHQLATRTEAHLFISVLAYHVLAAIEFSLAKAGDNRSWETIRLIMKTLSRGTIILAERGDTAHHIRVTTIPEFPQKEILKSLGITMPFKKIHQRIALHL